VSLNGLALSLATELERGGDRDDTLIAALAVEVPAEREELFYALVDAYRWMAGAYGACALHRAGLHLARVSQSGPSGSR
jgi:hypothetical protein